MKRKIPVIIRCILAAASIILISTPFVFGMIKLKRIYPELRLTQFGPDAVSLAGSFAWGTLFALVTIMLSAFLFGRFYCSVICPFGILQQMLGVFRRRKNAPLAGNHAFLRYGIAGAAFGALIFGWALFFRALDPYSIYGRIAANTLYPLYSSLLSRFAPEAQNIGSFEMISVVMYGIIPLILVILLVLWRKRIFCTGICPVGTVLGLASKHSLFKLRIDTEKCVSCGQCLKKCPADCIDVKNKKLDNERCLRCMNCFGACRFNAVKFTFAPRTSDVSYSESRRNFLIGATAAAFAAGGLANLVRPSKSSVPKDCVIPPGAGSLGRFLATCTGCRLCVTNCTGKVIRGPDGRIPYVHLDFTKGMCEYECHRCTTLCTTGALRFLTKKEKKVTRIGLAVFKASSCIAVRDGTACGACAEHCPTGALRMETTDSSKVPIPVLNQALCIGCGSCEYACPEKTIIVEGVDVQVKVESPEEYFLKNPPKDSTPEADNGEWLI